MKISFNSFSGSAFIALVSGTMLVHSAYAGSPTTTFDRFTNIGTILNTRHNLSQSTAPLIAGAMNNYRNDYGEVCVYCHTPHGANNTVAAPLWNRTVKVTNYATYNELGTTTLTQDVTATPGSASLTCLSCHDGQTAIDSIINMPGSGMGLLSQQTTQNTAFLDSWPTTGGGATQHMGFNSTNGVQGNGQGSATPYVCTGPGPGCTQILPGVYVGVTSAKGCLVCHSTTGALANSGPDFSMFNLGTDLRNDHPIGVTFPAVNGVGTDWKTPAGMVGASQFFDKNSNGKMEKAEIRTYEGKVECASCHDPHGVPSAGPGSVFNKTFLRVQNTNGSAVCLTCHTK